MVATADTYSTTMAFSKVSDDRPVTSKDLLESSISPVALSTNPSANWERQRRTLEGQFLPSWLAPLMFILHFCLPYCSYN